MGIRIHRNTWSAPLKLIDSWLPVAEPVARPTRLQPSKATSRFIRAGWLQRAASNDAPLCSELPSGATAESRRMPVAVPSPMQGRKRPADGRVGLSGRLVDVCAELDRLVALDLQRSHTPG